MRTFELLLNNWDGDVARRLRMQFEEGGVPDNIQQIEAAGNDGPLVIVGRVSELDGKKWTAFTDGHVLHELVVSSREVLAKPRLVDKEPEPA